MNIDTVQISNTLSEYGLKFIGALAIFLIGKWLVKTAAALTKTAMLKSKTDETLTAFVCDALYFLGLAFVAIAALGQLGIQTTSLAAILGAAGLAIGLSLQGSLGNIASGFMIIGTRPFKIGDFVEVAGKSGKVTNISIFSTEMRSEDNRRIIIPNGKITGDIIINHATH